MNKIFMNGMKNLNKLQNFSAKNKNKCIISITMMYPFMTLNDNTGIAHSDIILKDGKETVKVYFENASGF